jgi:hypothetical protein
VTPSWLVTLDVDDGALLEGPLRQLAHHRHAAITLPLAGTDAFQPDRLGVILVNDPVSVAAACVVIVGTSDSSGLIETRVFVQDHSHSLLVGGHGLCLPEFA